MFRRTKVSGNNTYLQIVENGREGRKTRQRIMTLLARKTPNGPAELLFSDLELLVIRDYAAKLLRTPKTLKSAVPVVAVMAGYRKHDPPPGRHWRSCFACQAYENFVEVKKSGRPHPLLSPEQG